MLKPKYIENILSITKEKRGEIECKVLTTPKPQNLLFTITTSYTRRT